MPMQTGYAVTIKGFVTVDRSDLDTHAKALAALQAAGATMQAAGAGNMVPLFELMVIEHIDVRPRTRHAPEPKADNGGFAGERGPEGPRG